ncbi:hypothetical protein BJX99DRAFT_170060 [Aspergillus californicus]
MSLDTTPQPSVSERRGQRLAPLQTNFSRPTSQIITSTTPRSQRQRPSDLGNGKTERVPLQAPHVKRQSSRPSLRHIFGRKSTDTKLSGIEEAQDPVEQAPAEAETVPLSPSNCATPRAAASIPASVAPSQSAVQARSRLQQKNRTKTLEEDSSPAEDVAWKPPALFKAYPQGLKHATLPAPTLSSDSIMRLHATFKARGASLHDDDPQAKLPANEEPSEEYMTRKKKLDKEKQKYIRALSDNIEKSEWTRKVYILATSGYILQYAGDGKHDRLPEKMLLLGPKSVAYASDAIPGKHWVLQVSQGSEEDSGTNSAAETPRPLFSRFGFHRSHARRLAQNLLLVFTDPDEMSSWLLAVRARIEARGGKKYVSEKVYDEGMESQLRTTPSMRQMVKKDPNRFSAVYLQPRQSMIFEDKDSSVGEQSRPSSYVSLHRRSVVIPPPESRSGSISTAHTEATSNAEEPARFYSTHKTPPLPDSSVVSETTSSVAGPSSPTFSSPKKRQSMFLPQIPGSEASELPRSQSTVPDPHIRSASPPAPNFSVPLFSKRFAARQDATQLPHLPPGRGDQHPDDVSIETVSMFSSPPQSPGRELFTIPSAIHEQRQPMDRRDHLNGKELRTSNSEDALGNPIQDRDRSRLRYSHLPEHIAMAPNTFNSPRPAPAPPKSSIPASHLPKAPAEAVRTLSRPSSIMMPSGPSSPPRTALPKTPTERENTSSRPSSLIMSRRKSLTGLAIGPPAAPPPTCPLPKIPSAFIRPSRQSAWPDHSPPMSPIEDAEDVLAAMSPLNATHNHYPRPVRSVTRHMDNRI